MPGEPKYVVNEPLNQEIEQGDFINCLIKVNKSFILDVVALFHTSAELKCSKDDSHPVNTLKNLRKPLELLMAIDWELVTSSLMLKYELSLLYHFSLHSC